jgi:hypothetical protein
MEIATKTRGNTTLVVCLELDGGFDCLHYLSDGAAQCDFLRQATIYTFTQTVVLLPPSQFRRTRRFIRSQRE